MDTNLENDQQNNFEHQMKSLAIIFSHASYGSEQGREGLDLALLCASYEIPVSVYFIGDGVYQLLKGQDPSVLEAKAYTKTFAALPLYEVESIYLCQQSLNERDLTPAQLSVVGALLDKPQIAAQLAQYDQVLKF